MLTTVDEVLGCGGGAVIASPIFAARSVNPLLCSMKDLLTASISCRFLVAKESEGGTLRLVPILDIALCTCGTALLLSDPEVTADDGVVGDSVARGVVAKGSGEQESSDTFIEFSVSDFSVPENVTKEYFRLI